MKKIINVLTKEEVNFTKKDLPILVHGKEHSGASLLSIIIASLLHKAGCKLCIFTAFPMAMEEFIKRVGDTGNIFLLENEKDFEKALKHQTIFIQSGNVDLFVEIIFKLSLMKDRIIFIKNIEKINTPIFELVVPYSFMVSGDFGLNPLHKEFIDFNFNTEIIFNNLSDRVIPSLGKYQAFMKNKLIQNIVIAD